MNVYAVAFASRIHGEGYYRQAYSYVSSVLRVPVYPEVVAERDTLKKAVEELRGSLPLAVVLTGGTSGLIQEFASEGGFRAVALLAQGEHNSLASAISARAALESRGVGVALFHCGSFSDGNCAAAASAAVRVARGAGRVLGARVGVVGSKPRHADVFSSRLGWTIEVVPAEELFSAAESAPREAVESFLSRVSGVPGFELYRSSLEHVGGVYYALRRLSEEKRLDAVAVDCFPYLVEHRVSPCVALALLNADGFAAACEADLYSALLMLVSRELTGSSGWIANATHFEGRVGVFSHCTIAFDIARAPSLVDHFESGYPVAVASQLQPGEVTVASLSRDLSEVYVARGRVVRSGFISRAMCRTQAHVEFDFDAEVIPLVAPANHHLVMPGDVVREVKSVSKLLGLRVKEYSKEA